MLSTPCQRLSRRLDNFTARKRQFCRFSVTSQPHWLRTCHNHVSSRAVRSIRHRRPRDSACPTWRNVRIYRTDNKVATNIPRKPRVPCTAQRRALIVDWTHMWSPSRIGTGAATICDIHGTTWARHRKAQLSFENVRRRQPNLRTLPSFRRNDRSIENWKLCDRNQWLDGLEPVQAESVEDRTHLVFHTSRFQQVHKGHRRRWIILHKSSEPREEPRSDTWRPTRTVEARIKGRQIVLLPDSTIEAHPSVLSLPVSSNLSSFVRHQSGGLLQRITSGSSEADGPTMESPQCSRPPAASCSSFWLQSMHEGQLNWLYMKERVTFSYIPRCTSACTEWPPLPQRAVRSSVHWRLSKSSPIGGQNEAERNTT